MIEQVLVSAALVSVAMMHTHNTVNLLLPVMSLQAIAPTWVLPGESKVSVSTTLFIAVSCVLLVYEPSSSIIPHMLCGLYMSSGLWSSPTSQ